MSSSSKEDDLHWRRLADAENDVSHDGCMGRIERDIVRERQHEGIAIAKKKGIYKGRKPSLSAERAVDLGGGRRVVRIRPL